MLGIICATETASEILFGGMIINLILISGHHICNSQQDVARLGSAGKRFKQVIDLLAHASKWRGAAPHGHLGPGTIVVEKLSRRARARWACVSTVSSSPAPQCASRRDAQCTLVKKYKILV